MQCCMPNMDVEKPTDAAAVEAEWVDLSGDGGVLKKARLHSINQYHTPTYKPHVLHAPQRTTETTLGCRLTKSLWSREIDVVGAFPMEATVHQHLDPPKS